MNIIPSSTPTGGTGSASGDPGVCGCEAFQLHCHVRDHHAVLLLHIRTHCSVYGLAGG